MATTYYARNRKTGEVRAVAFRHYVDLLMGDWYLIDDPRPPTDVAAYEAKQETDMETSEDVRDNLTPYDRAIAMIRSEFIGKKDYREAIWGNIETVEEWGNELRSELDAANGKLAAARAALEAIERNAPKNEPQNNAVPAIVYAQAWAFWFAGGYARAALAKLDDGE